MHFGIFMEEMRRGASPGEAIRDALELADAAEALGLHGVWLGELHFLPSRSALTAVWPILGAIASRTRRLRLGTAVCVLPLAHPLRTAEEVATVDHLSAGRFEFGVGRSGAARTYDQLEIPYAESQARFLEALAVIREAWKGGPFTFEGRFYRMDNVSVSPQPYQRPHPPLRMAATTPETFVQVARMGLPIFVGLRGTDVADLALQIQSYRAAWREAGHPGDGDVYLRIPCYAGATEKDAVDEARETILYYFQRQADLSRNWSPRGAAALAAERAQTADRLASLSYDHILKQKVAFGSAAGLVDRLGHLREELGLNGFVFELNPGGMLSNEQVLRTARVVAREVMPALL
jgi:alkanesulfonate monooxygenase SsuD/methylene tetrahydromethanopterin reductase-like flavin-dependent oxidoreductase (luciferase family)